MSEFIRWNEAMAHKYDPEAYHLRSNALIRWIERRRVRAILEYLHMTCGATVLEVGCGAGNVLERISAGQLYGIDLSSFLIKKSQTRLALRPARLTRADAENLPFADGRFQRLLCTEVLEHVLHPRCVLTEMARVATPDAIVVISVPNEVMIDRLKGIAGFLPLSSRLWGGRQGGYRSPSRMTDEWHLHSFSLELLMDMLKGIFVVRSVKSVPFQCLSLRYVVQCCMAPRAG